MPLMQILSRHLSQHERFSNQFEQNIQPPPTEEEEEEEES
jgi:hypothetical protein